MEFDQLENLRIFRIIQFGKILGIFSFSNCQIFKNLLIFEIKQLQKFDFVNNGNLTIFEYIKFCKILEFYELDN